jgi:predicted Zn-dependent protease
MIVGDNPAQGIFRDSLFLHPDLDLAITFPAGWKTTNVPVAVAAFEPGGNAQLFMGADDPSKDPDSLGNMFAQALEKEYNIQPSQNKSIEVNGYKGHLVSFKDLSGKSPVEVQLYWINTNSVMLNIMGMGYIPYATVLSDAAMSVRSLTAEEKEGIFSMRLRTVKAGGGESLQALSDRSGNAWSLETTAIMNDMDRDAVPEQGSLIKIAKKEIYP